MGSAVLSHDLNSGFCCCAVAAASAAADRARACQTAAEGMVEDVEKRLLTCAMPGADMVKAYGMPIQVYTPFLAVILTNSTPAW